MNALFNYPGSKWNLAPWITSFFPEHHSYVEPFFGSGAVFFSKRKSNIETINDINGDVINFFEWCKKDPEKLARELYLTPYSRTIYEEAKQKSNNEDSFKRAVNFAVSTSMSHGFKTSEYSGFKIDIQGRERSYCVRNWCGLPDRIMSIVDRMREVQIECRPAVEILQTFNFPNVLLYLDPPYPTDTRHPIMYECEMSTEDHEELLHLILKHKGPVIISSYKNPMYDAALSGWHLETQPAYNRNHEKKEETLYMNFEPGGHQMGIDEL